MQRTKVVNLGPVKDLLGEWERVRQGILSGRTGGFHVVFMDNETGKETIFLGGVYREDPQRALGASLKASAARALIEDEPPLFQATNF
jgi:hypothetical protein